MNDSWCILRCSPSSTLQLVASLRDDGFDAWTPVTLETKRHRTRRTREEVPAPLCASFVFVRADRFHDLLALSHSPSLQFRTWDSDMRRFVVKGHPFFRPFRGGEHRFIADAELEPMRRIERFPKPKRIERSFSIGDRVRTDDGGFAGLTGTVVAVKGRHIAVSFPDWSIYPEFPTWAMKSVDEYGEVNVNAIAPEREAA